MITEDADKTNMIIKTLAQQHPLLVESGMVDIDALAKDPSLKTVIKWLPAIMMLIAIYKAFALQRNAHLLRRIEKRLDTLDKSCPRK